VYELPTDEPLNLPTDYLDLPTVESVGKVRVSAEFDVNPEWRYEWATRSSGGIQFCRRGDGKGMYYVGPRSKPEEWKIYSPAFREWIANGKPRRKPTHKAKNRSKDVLGTGKPTDEGLGREAPDHRSRRSGISLNIVSIEPLAKKPRGSLVADGANFCRRSATVGEK
jgi:hypothetical protein